MGSELSPAAAGYRWPAEWEPHRASWVAWPHNPDTWPGKFAVIPAQFAAFVRTLARFEPVKVLAGGAAVRAAADEHLGALEGVELLEIPTNDAWCRDHGPTFLASPPELPAALIDWQYNAWGGKYPPFDLDNAVPRRLAELLGYRCFASDLVLEGGSIEGNGQGLLLTTASCLLNANRNPGRSREEVERLLRAYLGAERVGWLPRGELAGDDTDGHIDQLARFVGPQTLVACVSEDPLDPSYDALRENIAWLSQWTDAHGARFEVVPLPLPAPKFESGQRLPASYCNFYILNGAVIVPQFDDPADELAVRRLAELCPGREVVGVPALDLVWGLGAFHCLTQQQPRPA